MVSSSEHDLLWCNSTRVRLGDARGRMLALHPALDRRGGGFGSSKAAGAWRPRSCLDAANMGGPAIFFRKNIWEDGIWEETMGFVPANGACP